MGIFKSIKGMTGLVNQAKQLQEKQQKDAGYKPGVGGNMQQMSDMIGHAGQQLSELINTEADRARLLGEGIDGQATIVAMGVPPRSATKFNLMIDLEVHISGRAAYRVANDYLVPGSAQLGEGVTLPVKVDVNDPAKIAIDWDRAPTKPIAGQIRPVDPPT